MKIIERQQNFCFVAWTRPPYQPLVWICKHNNLDFPSKIVQIFFGGTYPSFESHSLPRALHCFFKQIMTADKYREHFRAKWLLFSVYLHVVVNFQILTDVIVNKTLCSS